MITIGRWGRLAEVLGPLPRMVHEYSRPRTYTEAADGTRFEVSAPVSRRTWQWTLEGRRKADLDAIRQLDHDSSKGHLHWMDSTAERSNMVRPEVAEPRAPHLGLSDEGTATVDGRLWDVVGGEVRVDVPTIQGVNYTVEVRASASTSLTAETLDIDRTVGAPVASQVGTGLLSDSWTAGSEAGVRITVDGDGWSGLQMFVTAHDPGGWLLGGGIPEVVMEGLSPALAEATPDEIWRGASVTLVEVDQ